MFPKLLQVKPRSSNARWRVVTISFLLPRQRSFLIKVSRDRNRETIIGSSRSAKMIEESRRLLATYATVAHSSFVSRVRFRADADFFHNFGDLADVWFSFGVPDAFIHDSHVARAQGWERIEQRRAADFCFADGIEFYRNDSAGDRDRTEDWPESQSGILVPGGGGDHSGSVGFITGFEVTVHDEIRWICPREKSSFVEKKTEIMEKT